MFLVPENTNDLLALAIYVRERINPSLFHYALSVTLMHRKDTKNVKLPAAVTTFPDRFFHSKVISKAREQAAVVPEEKRVSYCINLPIFWKPRNSLTSMSIEKEKLWSEYGLLIAVPKTHCEGSGK